MKSIIRNYFKFVKNIAPPPYLRAYFRMKYICILANPHRIMPFNALECAFCIKITISSLL